MDTVQSLLIAVVIVLTVMLVIVGFQVFYILREIRKTIDKANRVLNNAEHISESVKAPISSLSSMLVGIKSGTAIAEIIKKLREKSQQNKLSSGDLPTGRQERNE